MPTRRRYLYRVLRDDEDYHKDIKARDPDANKSVADHVERGSHHRSQFISTSGTLEAARTFARKSRDLPKTIVKIDIKELKKNEDVQFIDLSIKRVRNENIPSSRGRNFAKMF